MANAWFGSPRRFYNEYMFYRLIQDTNAELRANGYPEIKTTQARQLRKICEEILVANVKHEDISKDIPQKGFALASNFEMFAGFRNVLIKNGFASKAPNMIRTIEQGDVRKQYQMRLVNEFSHLTGMAEPTYDKKEWLPLSPYTPELSNRIGIIDAGSRLPMLSRSAVETFLSVNGKENEVLNRYNFANILTDMGTKTVPNFALLDGIPKPDMKLTEGGPVHTKDDITGLSALKPFMSQKEFDDLHTLYNGEPWASAALDANGNVIAMPEETISRVRELVARLKEEGYQFSFRKDAKPGQVRIQFDNKMQLRIIDPYEPMYAGCRIYDDGYLVYMQIRDTKSGKASESWQLYTPKTVDESMRLIALATGKATTTDEGKVAGENSTVNTGYNNSYHVSGNYRVRIGSDENKNPVYVYFKKYSRTNAKVFLNAEQAQDYLKDMIDSAKEHFKQEIDVESIIQSATDREMAMAAGDESAKDIIPLYSQDPIVKAIQEKYWNVLTTDDKTLYNPSYVTLDEDENEFVDEAHRAEALYQGTPEEIVRQHADDVLISAIGEYLGPGAGPQFDPVLVARYATNGMSTFRNNDNILTALRCAHFEPTDLKGTNFYNDVVRSRLVTFNPETAIPLQEAIKTNPFYREVFNTIGLSLQREGCSVAKTVVVDVDGKPQKNYKIFIDDNGIIQYQAYMKTSQRNNVNDETYLVGEIGQIFAPDENGVVATKTHMFVPGYEATIIPDKPGENKSYEERTRLRGYSQVIREAIEYNIHETVMASDLVLETKVTSAETDPTLKEYYNMCRGRAEARLAKYGFTPNGRKKAPNLDSFPVAFVGNPTSLNKAIQHLYDTRLPLDFYESHEKGNSREGISPELRQAIIDTNRSRIKYTNEIMEQSGRQSLYKNINSPKASYDWNNDNRMDAITLTDGRNPAVLESPADGIFDPYFTGNGPSQGMIRYLVKGAEVRADGTIKPAEDLNARCALVDYMREKGRQPDFDAMDRLCMSGNGLLQGIRETEPVGMAQISFGLNTFEDGIVISKEFAEQNRVPDAHHEGTLRPLKKGDKIECHGNKGVVSIIMDRNMPLDEAKKLGIEKEVEWFKNNPELDVVMSPYSAVSRFNAGMAREAMANNPGTLVSPDGNIYEGSLGRVRMTVLKQTVDTKSHANTEDGLQRRSYGAQFCWALAANDCPELLKDSFADNFKAIADLREYMIVCGMDMDETGRFLNHYKPQAGEERNLLTEPELIFNNGSSITVDKKTMRNEFAKQIGVRGGFVELPFQLDYPNGTKFAKGPSTLGKGDTYLMPVMSSYMRSGQEFQSGDSVVHDYTNEYLRIFEAGIAYRELEHKKNIAQRAVDLDRLSKQGQQLSPEDAAFLNGCPKSFIKSIQTQGGVENFCKNCDDEMNKLVANANSSYAKITYDITTRKFETKHNIFRTGLMSAKQKNSGTAVWHPDPSCPIDAVRMGADMAEKIGLAYRDKSTGEVKLKPNSWVLTHRDPVLRGSGVRYMRVEFEPDLVGIAVHPAGIPSGMDGDFDGDSVGLHVPTSIEAKAEARAKLSVMANLLDRSSYDEKNGRYKLFIADGQDITAGWAADDARRAKDKAAGKEDKSMSLRERYEDIEIRVNEFEDKYQAGEISVKEVTAKRASALRDIQSYLDDCAEIGVGRHVLSFASPEAHIKSIEEYVADGAKGNFSKVQTYARFAGIEYKTNDDGRILDGTAVMYDKSLASREEQIGIAKAKNMQQQYTGTGGSFSIRAMRVFMNACPDEATRLNYLATQGVLQSKHDPHLSDRFEHILSGPARNLWRGYKLERVEGSEVPNYSTDMKIGPNGERIVTRSFENTQVVDWQPVKSQYGYVRATPEEFVEQFMDIYGSKNGLGLKVNRKLVENLSDYMSETLFDGSRLMMSVEPAKNEYESSVYNTLAAPLQILAYDGNFTTMCEIATAQASDPKYPGLFDVPDDKRIKHNYNRMMADSKVMAHNLNVRDAMLDAKSKGVEYTGESYRPIVRPDVVVNGRSRQIQNMNLDMSQTDEQRKSLAERRKEIQCMAELMDEAQAKVNAETEFQTQQKPMQEQVNRGPLNIRRVENVVSRPVQQQVTQQQATQQQATQQQATQQQVTRGPLNIRRVEDVVSKSAQQQVVHNQRVNDGFNVNLNESVSTVGVGSHGKNGSYNKTIKPQTKDSISVSNSDFTNDIEYDGK